MGFTVTPLAQKARTKTLIADSDLNLGNYDLIATDVKGDTAEFSEFVGGVGNFSSGLISGGLDVSGILHAENTLQADGNIILEGSINNVNIADNGEITTAQGVNGADFNGAKITSTKFNGATIDTSGNVSGTTGTFSGAVSGTKFTRTTNYTVSSTAPSDNSDVYVDLSTYTCILPVRDKPYSGSITIKKRSVQGSSNVSYITSLDAKSASTISLANAAYSSATITLTNAQCLYIIKAPIFGIGAISIT